jgi:excisionase family DNA binding protein
MPTPTPELLLTVSETAAQVRVSAAAVRRWIRVGKLPGSFNLPSGQYRVPLSAVEAIKNGTSDAEVARTVHAA